MSEDKDLFKLLREGIAGKIILICFLVILLNIPLGMVKHVIEERNSLFDKTMKEISYDWGSSQAIIAPIMTVPVKVKSYDKVYNSETRSYENVEIEKEERYQILPEKLDIKAEIVPEMRHRGIFDILVHTTKLKISGNFTDTELLNLEESNEILWDKVVLNLGVDPTSIRGNTYIVFNGQEAAMKPGTEINNLKGVSAKIDVLSENNGTFDIELMFNGRGSVSFAPLGQKNNFEVVSKWPHPMFDDTFRPDNPEISEEGFKASWSIPYIARDYPQIFTSEMLSVIENSVATVGLYENMSSYKKTLRLVTYGIMFIALTFIMMLLFERKVKKDMSLVQYAIVGLAISLFFLTIMSLSEYLAFGMSYLIASAIVIMMISMYLYGALRNFKIASSGGFLMSILYGSLYVMLSDANYAMLIGTIILLITMAVLMWETRHMNEVK